MSIPFNIGKNSNGEYQFIDLVNNPLLMISYCDNEQLEKSLNSINQCSNHAAVSFYIMTVRRRLHFSESNQRVGLFLRDEPLEGTVKSRVLFLNKILQETRRRNKLLKSKKITSFNVYYSLNLWNKEKLDYRILLIDDVWDIVRAKSKQTGINLIRILLNGPAVGIYTILASELSYRNLLQQLVTINPRISEELQSKYGIPEPKQINLMGSEIIYSPDGLVFHKEKGSLGLTKYYP
jgi:hypothetical protein